jgi:hypothetical protein
MLEPKSSDIIKRDSDGGSRGTDGQYGSVIMREGEIIRGDTSERGWDAKSTSKYLSDLRLHDLKPVV